MRPAHSFFLLLLISPALFSQTYVDVSHEIVNGMQTYRGVPPPVITPLMSREQSAQNYAPGVTFLISKIDMAANTGTYLDTPYHRYENGDDLSELKLENLVNLPARIVRVDGSKVKHIDESHFKNIDLKGRALVVNTGHSKNWGTEAYFSNHPHLTAGAAAFLKEAGVKIVAIDTYNIDDTSDPQRPVHSTLLGAGIPVVEHVCNLENVPDGKEIQFTAVPIKIKDFSTFPVRAFVTVGK